MKEVSNLRIAYNLLEDKIVHGDLNFRQLNAIKKFNDMFFDTHETLTAMLQALFYSAVENPQEKEDASNAFLPVCDDEQFTAQQNMDNLRLDLTYPRIKIKKLMNLRFSKL